MANYVLAGMQLISQTRDSTTKYFLQDGQGSTRGLVSNVASPTINDITDTYSYTAFGELYSSTGTTVNSYRYTGQQFDSSTGLYSLRARYYNPALGRFLSQDTYPVNFGNPVELNRYVYAANRPINLTDPTGKTALPEYSLLIGGIGGTLGGMQAYLCGGSLGSIIEATIFGAAMGIGFAAIAAMSPAAATAAAGTGMVLSGAGFLTSYYDMLKNGASACNRFGLAMSLMGMLFGGLGTMGPPGPAFALSNRGTYVSTAQLVGSSSQLLSGLGGISLVSMMSGGSNGEGSDELGTQNLLELLRKLKEQTDISENCNAFVNRYLVKIKRPTLPPMPGAAEVSSGYGKYYEEALLRNFTKISDLSSAQPGDLITWAGKRGVNGEYNFYKHIGVYLGDGLYFSKLGPGLGFEENMSVFDPRISSGIMEIWR